MRSLFLIVMLCTLLVTGVSAQDQVTTVWRASEKHPEVSGYLLKNKGALDRVPLALSKALRLPRKLPIIYEDYGNINAAYIPAKHSVRMGYELLDYAFRVFKRAGYDDANATRLALDAFTFVLLHEIGHAVIGELELPVTGREEDCADEFATWVCSNLLAEEGKKVARGGALLFYHMGQGGPGDFPWWDEHSFDLQRSYRIAADIHAFYPNALPELNSKIPQERLDEAARLKPTKRTNWLRQLAPHLTFDVSGFPRLKPAKTQASEGHLRARLGTSKNRAWAGLLKKWETTRAHEKMLSVYDEMFLWPRDVEVLFTDTGTKRCSYSKDQARIVISVDTFGEMAAQLSQADAPREELEAHLKNLISYSVLYEISRALIGELDLPYTGAPEDAANELTTLMLVTVPSGQEVGLTMIDWLDYQSTQRKQYLWSDQSLDVQQMYDMAGYLFAADQKKFVGVMRIIPSKARLARYVRDYQLKDRRWSELLQPYVAAE